MKIYKVNQKFRCCYNINSEGRKTATPYRFSPDVAVGEYSEKDFKELLGKEFFDSGYFAKYCENGWIKVVDTKDITKKVANKSLDILE